MIVPHPAELAIESQHWRTEAILRPFPSKRSGTHPATAALVVFRNPVVLRELLSVGDHRRASGGEQGDSMRLGPVPFPATFVRTRASLPGYRGVVMIAEIVRGDLVGAGDVLRIVQRREVARPDLSRP